VQAGQVLVAGVPLHFRAFDATTYVETATALPPAELPAHQTLRRTQLTHLRLGLVSFVFPAIPLSAMRPQPNAILCDTPVPAFFKDSKLQPLRELLAPFFTPSAESIKLRQIDHSLYIYLAIRLTRALEDPSTAPGIETALAHLAGFLLPSSRHVQLHGRLLANIQRFITMLKTPSTSDLIGRMEKATNEHWSDQGPFAGETTYKDLEVLIKATLVE
jgi:hypothetical protein